MKDVVVFPGFNALIVGHDRTRFLSVPNVQKRLEEASQILSKVRSEETDLIQLCLGDTASLYQIKNSPLTAASITAIQVGLYEEAKEKISPDAWFMGCSLGDIARTICVESIDFKELIHSYAEFMSLSTLLGEIGFNAVIYSIDPISMEQLNFFKSMDLSVSSMSSYFINIAGSNQDYKAVNQYANSQRWRFQKILNFPAHSTMLEKYIRPFWEQLPKGEIKVPTNRLFSSLSCKELFDNVEIQNEVYLNMVSPVRWAESVEYLVREHNINRMINIGPCESLPKITKRSGHALEFINSWDL